MAKKPSWTGLWDQGFLPTSFGIPLYMNTIVFGKPSLSITDSWIPFPTALVLDTGPPCGLSILGRNPRMNPLDMERPEGAPKKRSEASLAKYFPLLKNVFQCFFVSPLLVLKGICHYWILDIYIYICCFCSSGLNQMEEYQQTTVPLGFGATWISQPTGGVPFGYQCLWVSVVASDGTSWFQIAETVIYTIRNARCISQQSTVSALNSNLLMITLDEATPVLLRVCEGSQGDST